MNECANCGGPRDQAGAICRECEEMIAAYEKEQRDNEICDGCCQTRAECLCDATEECF